jgi:hypothetical protein
MARRSTNTNNQNGWNEWSNVVLNELERLNQNYTEIDGKMDFIKTELTKVKAVWNSIEEFKEWKKSLDDKAVVQKVDELYEWKAKIDEIWSPTQMKDSKDKLEKQVNNWTVLITIWAVVQFVLGILLVFKDKIFGS